MLGKTIAAQTASILALLAGILLTGNLWDIMKNPFSLGIAAAAVVVAVIVFVVEVKEALSSRVRRFRGAKRDEKIRAFMIKLLREGGNCVMSSNDLSWVDGESEKELRKKAKENSLELLMPRETPKSKRLEALGAKVHYYGDSSFRFESRFTIVNAGRSGSYVAIGHGELGVHFIRLSGEKGDPVLDMANDLRRLAERHAKVSS